LNLIDIKVSFELYLFIMTGQSITNTYSLLSITVDHSAHVVILLSGLRGTIMQY